MIRRSRSGSVAVAAVALLALGGGIALAQKAPVTRTAVSISFTADPSQPTPVNEYHFAATAGVFSGMLRSRPPARLGRRAKRRAMQRCRRGRVVIVHDRRGLRVGRTRANDRGRFRLEAEVPPGGYVARAPRKAIKLGKRGRVVCAEGSSRPVPVR